MGRIANEGRVKTYVDRKRSNFFPAGLTDFIHEIYLCLSFAVCINLSELKFTAPGIAIHNLLVLLCAIVLAIGPIIISLRVSK